ncbi:efflux RND transporter periplasmic adaptor subunit [Gluconobacter frateurii]|uniref:Cation efflux protein n=1 Tax=Gluconobacter frateurii NRIC 0228 TaxID=1307946 RepID=A0ABQ0QF32_9PROT|nr:efflux RND transporter periplasmic adaptor subunit [Gluconobacter frateurii]GBR16635.1 cation efflux protein [Gluconobacter frateurii NRIC 0228]GLP90622.1 RND transporter [Gluconobacter frateurii]
MKKITCLTGLLMASCLQPVKAETPAWLLPLKLDVVAQKNENFQVSPARYGDMHATISAMATVSADTSRVVVIRPAGGGKVTDVLVTPGQRVRQGQTLINYTDHTLHELHLQRMQVQAALASARAAVTEADQAYRRGLALAGTTVSTGEVKRRLAQLQQDRSIVVARQADMGTIEHRVNEEFTSVTEKIVQDEASSLISPVNGIVQTVSTSAASDINSGEALATVVDLSSVWIVAQVRPQEASQLAIGSKVFVRPSGDASATPFTAHITTIDGLTDAMTGLVRVVCVVDRSDGQLRPGSMLDASLDTVRTVHGLVVPASAVERVDGHTVVYVKTGPEAFQPHEVKLLLENDDQAVVEGNLPQEASIVGNGSFVLKSMTLLGADGG